MARRKARKVITRRITITLAGKHIKTTRNRITLRAAIAQCGEDRFFTQGDTIKFSRRINKVLKVSLEYTAHEHLIENTKSTHDVNTKDAQLIARQNMVI